MILPRVGWRQAAVVLLPVLLIACGGGNDRAKPTPRDWQVHELLALVPGQSPATVFADGVALENAGEAGISRLLDRKSVAEPALARIADQILLMIEGINSPEELRRLAMAQSAESAEDYLLLADTESNSIETLYSTAPLEFMTRYRQVDIYAHPRLDLYVGMLPGALLAIGPAATLRDLIDQLPGEEGSETGATPDPLTQPLGFYLEIAAQGAGSDTLSLSNATTSTGLFGLEDDTLTGTVSIRYREAEAYVERFNALAEGTTIPALETDDAGNIVVPVALGLADLADRFYIGRLFQAFDGVIYADGVAVGGNPPWLNFNVDTGPNSIFINFEFANEALRQQFEASELPDGFQLAPLRILEGDEPAYYLVLNIYQSSGGLVQGGRAEWSVFVKDPVTGLPRFLVVQAAAEAVSADPVNLLTLPEPVSHRLEDGQVVSYVGQKEPDGSVSLYFRSAFEWPRDEPQTRGFAREFVAANDFIFWGNAVADRGTFNGSVYAREAVLIPNSALALEDNSYWSKYLKRNPRHAFVYQNDLEIVISPWWNLDAGYLDVTSEFRQELVDFSNAFYPPTMQARAQAAFRGEGSVVASRSENRGAFYLHFRISDPQGMQALLGDHSGFQLAPVALVDGEVPDYLLTLNVYQLQDDSCALRADWMTYVSGDSASELRAMKLLAQAAATCLDADALLYPPSRLVLTEDDSRVRLDLEDLLVKINASVDPSVAIDTLPGLQWLESLDELCARSAVCDRRFIDGDTLKRPLQQIDPSAVNLLDIRSPWDDYIDHEPLAVWISTASRLRIDNPWVDGHRRHSR